LDSANAGALRGDPQRPLAPRRPLPNQIAGRHMTETVGASCADGASEPTILGAPPRLRAPATQRLPPPIRNVSITSAPAARSALRSAQLRRLGEWVKSTRSCAEPAMRAGLARTGPRAEGSRARHGGGSRAQSAPVGLFAGVTNALPPNNTTEMTDDDRRRVAKWATLP